MGRSHRGIFKMVKLSRMSTVIVFPPTKRKGLHTQSPIWLSIAKVKKSLWSLKGALSYL